MINLLPPLEKQKLYAEKKSKIAAIWAMVVLVALVVLLLILLSIKFYILSLANEQKEILKETQSQVKTAGFDNLNNAIKKYNLLLGQADSFYKKEAYFNEVLKVITYVPEPKGLYLTTISIARDAKDIIKAGVSGESDTRENLLLFKKNIEAETRIKNVSFSLGSWTSPEDVSFSLTFDVNL